MSSQTMTKENGSAKKAIVAGVLAAALALGGVFAYLTATDTATNKLSVATALSIDVQEPQWDALPDTDGDGIPDAATNMLPGESVTKDPLVKNTSNVEGYMIAQVKIPVIGEGDAAKELYTYDLASTNWEEQGTAVIADGVATHTYFYKTTVAGQASTDNIFTSVKLMDFGNASGIAAKQQIVVDGFSIQKEGFADCATAWAAYQAQNAPEPTPGA